MFQQLVLPHLRPALTVFAVMAAGLGLIYPLSMTGLAQLLFPDQARGSLVLVDGEVRGSALIGQAFTAPHYFHGRPSAVDFDAADSGASNHGQSVRVQVEAVRARTEAVLAADGGTTVPVDRVTASASGLDPHVTPASAFLQAARIAAARGIDRAEVEALIQAHVEPPVGGLLGASRVNVLRLNLALDAMAPLVEDGAEPAAEHQAEFRG